MRGDVVRINARRGMVAVSTEGGYSIIELFGDDLEMGDKVSWAGTNPLGLERLKNLTQGTEFDVYFQNHHVSEASLLQQLL